MNALIVALRFKGERERVAKGPAVGVEMASSGVVKKLAQSAGRSRRALILFVAAAALLIARRLGSAKYDFLLRVVLSAHLQQQQSPSQPTYPSVLTRTRLLVHDASRRLRLHVRARVQMQLEQHLEQQLDRAASRCRCMLKDDAMPIAIRQAVDSMCDSLLPDIKLECWRW